MRRDPKVLVWPQEADEAERLRKLRIPRLLLVAANAEPPRDADLLVDWVRTPASEQEVAARVVALMRRAEDSEPSDDEPPTVDPHGRLTYRQRWAALSPTEAKLATVLCEQFTNVVSQAELLRRVWRSEDIKRSVLRVHLTRLRHRISLLGLEIVSIRTQGVVLQPCPVAPSPSLGATASA